MFFFKHRPKKEEKEGKERKEEKEEKKEDKTGIVSAGVIRSFWISEKATDGQKENKYTFLVRKNAPKPEIRKTVERRFKVKVTHVATIMRSGKRKRFKAVWGRTPEFRKAIVTLKEGDKIEVL